MFARHSAFNCDIGGTSQNFLFQKIFFCSELVTMLDKSDARQSQAGEDKLTSCLVEQSQMEDPPSL